MVSVLFIGACTANDGPALREELAEADRRISALRNELDDERTTVDDLRRRLEEAERALSETPTTTGAPSSMTTTTPPPVATTSSPMSEEEALFRSLVAAEPDRLVGARCDEGDGDCAVEAALLACGDLRNSETATLGRLSPYSSTFVQDLPFYSTAIEVFCPDQEPWLAVPLVIFSDGVYEVVETSLDPPREIPSGGYVSNLDRGSECFWQRRAADGTVVADALVPVVDRGITLTVTVEPGETFATFGCRYWTPLG